MNIFLSELQEKDVISIKDGQCYGHIVDVQINDAGSIISFVAENRNIFKKLKNNEITFSYKDIEKIGKDVILINV